MEEKQKKIVTNIKRGGSIMVYVGTASLARPLIAKARENQNGAMQACTIFGGTIISLGIAKKATEWMNQVIDKVADFFDDVKPKKPEKEEKDG